MMNDEIAYFTVRWKTRASFGYRSLDITPSLYSPAYSLLPLNTPTHYLFIIIY